MATKTFGEDIGEGCPVDNLISTAEDLVAEVGMDLLLGTLPCTYSTMLSQLNEAEKFLLAAGSALNHLNNKDWDNGKNRVSAGIAVVERLRRMIRHDMQFQDTLSNT